MESYERAFGDFFLDKSDFLVWFSPGCYQHLPTSSRQIVKCGEFGSCSKILIHFDYEIGNTWLSGCFVSLG